MTAAPKGLARTLEADIPVGASVDRNGWEADIRKLCYRVRLRPDSPVPQPDRAAGGNTR
jgi:hypothetical protein